MGLVGSGGLTPQGTAGGWSGASARGSRGIICSSKSKGNYSFLFRCTDSWNVAGTFGHQMGEGVGSTPRNSATAGRCPAVDLSSDTTYLECRVPQNCWGRQHSRLAPVPREQAGWSGGESNPSAVTVLVPGGSHGDGHREQGWDQGSQGWRWVWMDTGIAKEMGARPAGRRDSSMHLGLQDTKGWPRKKLKV